MTPGVRIGIASVERCQHGYAQKEMTLAECEEAVEHPTKMATRAELVQAVAYLSAQIVGLQRSKDRDAVLAIHQIESALREYRNQHNN